MSKPNSDANLKLVAAFSTLRPFFSQIQMAALTTMTHSAHSEEWQFYVAKVEELADLVAGMAQTYQQEGKGEQATVYLHYFIGGSDWYITEKDVDGGAEQAFGYAVLNGAEDCCRFQFNAALLTFQLALPFVLGTLASIAKMRSVH